MSADSKVKLAEGQVMAILERGREDVLYVHTPLNSKRFT